MSPYINGDQPDVRETKLPVWAQDLISDLRRKLTQERSDGQELRDYIAKRHPGEVNTFVDEGFQKDRLPLGKGVQVVYTLPDRRWMPDIRVRLGSRGLLEINGDDALVLYPHSGNHILVGLTPHDKTPVDTVKL